MKTPEQGAATSVWCATSPQPDGLGGSIALTVTSPPKSQAIPLRSAEFGRGRAIRTWPSNPDLAERLWRLSEQLTGGAVH
jgi:hypothetical protein